MTIRVIEIWHGEDGKYNYSHTFNHGTFFSWGKLCKNMIMYTSSIVIVIVNFDNSSRNRRKLLVNVTYFVRVFYKGMYGMDCKKERGVHTLKCKEMTCSEKNGVIIRLFCKNIRQMEKCRSILRLFCFHWFILT